MMTLTIDDIAAGVARTLGVKSILVARLRKAEETTALQRIRRRRRERHELPRSVFTFVRSYRHADAQTARSATRTAHPSPEAAQMRPQQVHTPNANEGRRAALTYHLMIS